MSSQKALSHFRTEPERYNCAQAVCFGADNLSLIPTMANCGGGKAPDGTCGALYAAMSLCPESQNELKNEFITINGGWTCQALKKEFHIPCEQCVQVAAELVEKYHTN